MQLSSVIGERSEEFDNTRALENRVQHLERKVAHWKEVFTEYGGHRNDCNISEMAAAGRDIEVKCSCGYNDRIKSIEG